MSKGHENTAVVKRLYAQLLAGDMTGFQAQLDASFVLRTTDSLPYGGRREGVGALQDAMQGFLKCWKSPTFEFRQYTCDDDGTVVAHIELSALSKAGKPFSTPVLECWTLVGDRVTALDVHYLFPAAALRAIHPDPDK